MWGFLRGPQQTAVHLRFEVPSACADSLANGSVDIGIIPAIEMYRQKLPYITGLGIASDGPVRSIFIVSRVPAAQIETLAVDTSSRTSVALARVILSRKYKNEPKTIPHAPDLPKMLAVADAALIIGDPALRLDPVALPFHVYDLGSEWKDFTGLPMVYAVWSGYRAPEFASLFRDSCLFGLNHLEDIVESQRDFPPELARTYLTRHIQFELTERHARGLALYLELAGGL